MISSMVIYNNFTFIVKFWFKKTKILQWWFLMNNYKHNSSAHQNEIADQSRYFLEFNNQVNLINSKMYVFLMNYSGKNSQN